MIKKTEILPKIFLLKFDNNTDLGSTFLRFQEFYESPKFKGKFFTFDEFKKWYIKDRKMKKFTYCIDWTGFNIPSYILKPFIDGKFDPLSNNEKQFLNLFKDQTKEFYVIGVSLQSMHLLDHEIAHGLYYTNKSYKKEIINILKKFDTSIIRNEIKGTGGYCEEVLDDEVHAWILDIPNELKSEIPRGLQEQIRNVFEKYKNK